MILVHDLAQTPAVLAERGSAVTIGKFDGVHLGHRRILELLSAHAARAAVFSVVFTFEENPLALVRPELCPEPVASPEQRIEQLSELHIDAVIMVPFTRELSELEPEEFVEQVLVERLGVRQLYVGRDFRFGRGGSGTVDTLVALAPKFGFTVEVIEDVLGDAGARVSSTMIREALTLGDVAHAAELLGRAHRVTGTVVRGDQRGRELGFPTANLSTDAQGFMPADGVYAGCLFDADHRYPAAISIGTNPTFAGERERRIEAFVIDATIDLYDKRVHVDFVQRLRPTLTFDSVDALIEQMHDDVDEARAILSQTKD